MNFQIDGRSGSDLAKSTTTLKRTISLPLLLFYGLGNIIGAGIYVLIGEVAGQAGYFAPVAFLVTSIVAGFTAISYAELSARFPVSAGEAVYLLEGFNSKTLAAAVGLLVAMSGIVAAATIAKGFIGYLDVFITLPEWLVVMLLLATLGGLAAWGITESVTAASALTLVEIGGLLWIIWVGHDSLSELPAHFSRELSRLDPDLWANISVASFLAFFAFIGFEDMVNVAEEVKQPQRTLPLAISLALVIATLLYAGVSLVAVSLVKPAELSGNSAPLALLYERATGAQPWLIGAISIAAVVNGALIQIIMASRIVYGMSRKGMLPAILTLVNLALVRIKQRHPVVGGVRLYPMWIPVVGFLTCIGLLLVRFLLGD